MYSREGKRHEENGGKKEVISWSVLIIGSERALVWGNGIRERERERERAVSYTHLTLPTIVGV